MDYRILISIVILFCIAPLISAVPPFQTQSFSEGFNIQIPQDNILKQNQDYTFEFHVINISNGKPIVSGINCTFHLYNSTGGHKFESSTTTVSDSFDYSFKVLKGNFSKIESQYYFIGCNSTILGGFGESIIRITPNGEEFSTSQSTIYILVLITDLILLAIFVFLSFTVPYENEGRDSNNGPIITRVTKTKYLKLMSIWISYYLSLAFINILAGVVNNYLSFEPVQIMISNVYIFGSFLGYGFSIFMIWLIFFNIWKDIILNKVILREGSAVLRDLK